MKFMSKNKRLTKKRKKGIELIWKEKRNTCSMMSIME
jgi:hypothetical protein